MFDIKKNFKHILKNFDLYVASLVLSILVILTFLGVIWRYILHVAIEIIFDLIPKKYQKLINIFISIVVVIVIGFLFLQSIGFISVFIKSGRSTSMLKIPYSVIYGIAILSYIDMIISYFYALFSGVKSEVKEAIGSNE